MISSEENRQKHLSQTSDTKKVLGTPYPMYFSLFFFLSMHESDIWKNQCLIKFKRVL